MTCTTIQQISINQSNQYLIFWDHLQKLVISRLDQIYIKSLINAKIYFKHLAC